MCDTGSELKLALWDLGQDSDVSTGEPFNGIIAVIQPLVAECCHPSTQLTTTRVARHQRDLVENFDLKTEDFIGSVTRPSSLAGVPSDNALYRFYGADQSPGMTLLLPDSSQWESHQLISSLVVLSQLLTIMIMGCVMAGILIWAADCRINKAEFPRQFPKGLSAGTWWAFVSMTTVGYGDKTPKSYSGRILGCVWILAGMILIAIFTAALTTLFTKDGDVDTGVFGKKVGVMNGSEDMLSIMMMGGKTVGYANFDTMVDGLVTRQVSRLAVDIMHTIRFTKKLEAHNIRFHEQIYRPITHGFIANKRRFGPGPLECFQFEMERQRYEFHETLDSMTSMNKLGDKMTGSETLKRLLHIQGQHLWISASLIAALVAAIALIDRFYLSKSAEVTLAEVKDTKGAL